MAKFTVIKATGMVPVKVIDDTLLLSVKNGDVFGVAPLKAEELLALKVVEKAAIPEDTETEVVETYVEKADGQEFRMVRPFTKAAAAPAAGDKK